MCDSLESCLGRSGTRDSVLGMGNREANKFLSVGRLQVSPPVIGRNKSQICGREQKPWCLFATNMPRSAQVLLESSIAKNPAAIAGKMRGHDWRSRR
jgi:hypothetical protein